MTSRLVRGLGREPYIHTHVHTHIYIYIYNELHFAANRATEFAFGALVFGSLLSEAQVCFGLNTLAYSRDF